MPHRVVLSSLPYAHENPQPKNKNNTENNEKQQQNQNDTASGASAQSALTAAAPQGVAPGRGVAGSASADPCAMSINFFPRNYEDSNTPAGWTRTVQSNAGNQSPTSSSRSRWPATRSPCC